MNWNECAFEKIPSLQPLIYEHSYAMNTIAAWQNTIVQLIVVQDSFVVVHIKA